MAIDRYRTPDGSLELLVIREADEITVGFDSYSWHTHGDVLAADYGIAGVKVSSPEEAVQRFLSDLRSDRAPIIMCRKSGKVYDVYAAVSMPARDKYMEPGETAEIRYWSGRGAHAS